MSVWRGHACKAIDRGDFIELFRSAWVSRPRAIPDEHGERCGCSRRRLAPQTDRNPYRVQVNVPAASSWVLHCEDFQLWDTLDPRTNSTE